MTLILANMLEYGYARKKHAHNNNSNQIMHSHSFISIAEFLFGRVAGQQSSKEIPHAFQESPLVLLAAH